MTNRLFWIFTHICCAGMISAQPARSEQGASPICLYDSKSYSDGAYICAQKFMMLTCSSDGTRATWKIVADRDISERCVSPIALNPPPLPHRHAHRTHMVHRWSAPAREASSKCFSFNGKQYCE